MLRAPYFWAGLVLFSLLYFLLTGSDYTAVTVVAVVWAALSGMLAVLFLGLAFSAGGLVPERGGASLMAACAVVLGVLLKLLTGLHAATAADMVAVPLAALSAWGFEALRGWSRPRSCFICRQPVGPGGDFTCPRCGQHVCARPVCWSSRHLRCTSCLEREVVLLPLQEEWWRRQFGQRVQDGACDSCYKEAHETDLRACGQCPLRMCKRCWDHLNGCCPRCGWHVAELPPLLRPLARVPPPRRGSHRGARMPGDGRDRPRAGARGRGR